MISRLQKLPLVQRKAIVGGVAVILGISLFWWQLSALDARREKFDFALPLPQEETERLYMEISTIREELGSLKGMMEEAREELRIIEEMDEETFFYFLEEEEILTREKIEKIKEAGGLEALEEEELEKLLEKSIEENGEKEGRQ